MPGRPDHRTDRDGQEEQSGTKKTVPPFQKNAEGSK